MVIGALVCAGALIVGSLALLEVAATESAGDRQRPRITADLTWTPVGVSLKGQVEMGGLKNRHHVLVVFTAEVGRISSLLLEAATSTGARPPAGATLSSFFLARVRDPMPMAT